jgi:hypothetical protein
MHKWDYEDLIMFTGRTFESAAVMIRTIWLYAGESHSCVALFAIRAAYQKD